MDTTHGDTTAEHRSPAFDESLPPFVAYQVEEESREHAPSSSGSAGEHYRQGKVEAETRRISEEVTHEAQRRLRDAHAPSSAHAEIPSAPARAPATTMSHTAPRETPLPTPTMLRCILAPLDGTLLGERVFPYVAELARFSGARVLLAHVTPTEPPAVPLGRMLRLEGSRREDALRAFAPDAVYYLQYVRNGRLFVSPQADTLHITAPTVADGLLTIEKSREIDLVALALRNHGEGDHMSLGAVVDKFIRFGAAPALVIPPEADAGAHPFAVRHILVPLDGSPLAEEALGPLSGLLIHAQTSTSEPLRVTLLGVAEDNSLLPDYQAYLDALRDTLLQQPAWAGAQIYAEAIVGSPPGAIVGAVNRGNRSNNRNDTEPVDLLVMTTHGRGRIDRLLLGSVTNYVLPRAHVPVLVVHPAARFTSN